jgi:hypothetical protein
MAHAAIAAKPRPGGDMPGNRSDTMGTMERIAGTRTASPLSMFRDPAWCVALAAAIAFAIAVRGAMLFRGEVPAGVEPPYAEMFSHLLSLNLLLNATLIVEAEAV